MVIFVHIDRFNLNFVVGEGDTEIAGDESGKMKKKLRQDGLSTTSPVHNFNLYD